MEEIILKNKPKLIKWLCSDYVFVLQHVQAKQLITMSQYEDLMVMKAKDSVIKLLDTILRSGENVCRDFLDLLKDDDVNEISPELRDWIKTVDTEGKLLWKSALCTFIERPKVTSFIHSFISTYKIKVSSQSETGETKLGRLMDSNQTAFFSIM